jgi:site-specific DNA-methyltransferase (adenine-specific)
MLDFGYYNMDCLEGMKQFPDNYFDLAIVDPPYGGGSDEYDATTERYGGRFAKYFPKEKIDCKRTGGAWASKYGKNICNWDVAPPKEYFDELFRVSKNQIIWGGNYFDLPPTRCFVVWKKLTISESFSMAMAEYAWTSFNDNAKIFECAPQGKPGDNRFHPTQKPIALYEWLLSRYAKDGDIILDTHVGSASSLIACHRTNHKFVGFELDETYYKLSKERLEKEQAQMNIFDFI